MSDHSNFLRPFRRQRIGVLLAALSLVETISLPEEDRSCPVCMENYDTSTAATGSEPSDERECAIRLQCQHVMGKDCLRCWLEGGNATCPFCRTNIYQQSMGNVSPARSSLGIFFEIFEEAINVLGIDHLWYLVE